MQTLSEILPDLYRIEVPLPGNPLKSVNSWVVRSGERTLVIDTGMRRAECEVVLRSGLEELGVDLETTDVFVTHIHADHMGLVGEIASASSTVYFNRPDADLVDRMGRNPEGSMHDLVEEARRGGFPEQEIQEALDRHPGFRYSPPSYPPFTFLEDGDELRRGRYRLRAVATPGHTPGHTCLYDQEHRVLFSGDHVLGDITPNITLWGKEDSLGDFLESLDRVAELDVDLVLPGHRAPFDDLGSRVEELRHHHRDRLAEVVAILGEGPRTAYGVASRMTWDIVADSWNDFPVVQKWFAVGEAGSHLRYLELRGRIVPHEREGVVVYRLSD